MARSSKQQIFGNKKIALTLFVGVVLMFGFGFALVPLYNTFCNVLGINGKTGGAVAYDASTAQIDKDRWVTVEFVATKHLKSPWKFYPETKKVKIHPGEIQRVAFFAENDTDHSITIQAIPSVTPGYAAKYLKKTECFCFTQQTLTGHESMDMPLLFHLDPALPKKVHTMTLSYTIFDVTKKKTNSMRNSNV